MIRLEPLSRGAKAPVLEYLAREPYDNVFVGWVIESGMVAEAGPRGCLIARDREGAIAGVCYYGPQFVPIGDSADVIDAFAECGRDRGTPRMIVGRQDLARRFAEALGPWLPRPLAVRETQPVYALTREGLRAWNRDVPVARGDLDEIDELAAHSARMIAHEVGGSDRSNPSIDARTERIVRRGWWWRLRIAGELVFQCNVGSVTAQTAQIQGVWTPPEHRGRGYATQALAAICARLLDEYPTLSLYVNDFNHDAIALYERVGFTRASTFSTYIY